MRPVTVSVGPLAAASATNIRTASTATAGAMVLNGSLVSGGIATLDSPRQILFTTAASEAGHTVLLTGTARAGNAQSETITLPSSATTVASTLSYATVASAVISANSNNNISIGTNGVSSSGWVRLDDYAPGQTGVQVSVSGTVNATVQSTMDDPNDPTNPVSAGSMTWVNSADAAAVGLTGSIQTNFQFAPKYVRLLLNSGTGSAAMTVLQSSVGPL